MGGDFFRLPQASEVITKRRLFAGRRTRIILPWQKAGIIIRPTFLIRVRDCSGNPSPEDCSVKPNPQGDAPRIPFFTRCISKIFFQPLCVAQSELPKPLFLFITTSMKKALLYVLTLLCTDVCFSQIQTPQPPQFQRYDGTTNTPMPNPYGQVQMGATAEDIMRQNNRNNPYYGYGHDQASIQRASEAWIRSQMANDPAYNPALRNGVNNKYPLNKQQELFNLLQEIAIQDNNRAANNNNLQDNRNAVKSYHDALRNLKNMLSGKQRMSVADAYFSMENAYGEAYLTHDEYMGIIRQSADFIRQWMRQHDLNEKDNASINYAVQQFMGEQLTISKPTQTHDGAAAIAAVTHMPFSYDYQDYQADKDHRNFFVTKCLATGMGQCNSMPAVYLVLVEALGGKAYLAVAPQHSLVKYPDSRGNITNYEPTSHWNITNEWYYDNMFISKQAAMHRLYLNPWGGKQIVADIALQLSFGYFRKFGGADSVFLKDCINTAKAYFPQNNNLTVYFNLSNLYGYNLAQAMRKNGINRISDIAKSTEAQKQYAQWKANEDYIEQLGYQDQPRDMYEEMMKYHEFRGKVQTDRQLDGKHKRSLFIQTNSSPSK